MEEEPCRVTYARFRDPRPVRDAQGRTRIICITHGLSVYSDAFAARAWELQRGQAERRMYDAHLRRGVETKAHNVTVVAYESHPNWGPLTGMYPDQVKEMNMEHNVREGAVCWIGVETGVQPELFAEERDALRWLGDDRPSPTVGGAYVAPGDRRRLWEVTLRGVKEMEVVPAQLAVRKPR